MLGFDRLRRSGAAAVLTLLAMLAVLLLCSIAWGADGPQEYIYRPFWRTAPLSTASQMVNGTLGDRIRCFSVSLTDTTGNGVDATYTADVRYNWQFSLPDSGAICDCYEIAGSPDSLLWNNVWIPGKGRKESANQFSTDSRGRLKINRTVRADTLAASVIASKSAAGTVVSTDTLRVMMHARVASNLKVQGGTTLGNAAADTVKMIGNVRVQNSFTTQGATTLGNAATDAITSKGAFTAEDDLTAGNDSTDVFVTRGIPRAPEACRCFTFTAGASSRAFTFPKAQAGWLFLAQFQDANGKTIQSVSRTATDEVTVRCGVSVTSDSKICIWAWKP